MSRSEHQIQTELVTRIRAFYPGVVVFAIPNGGARDPRTGARLKAEGVLAGVPDLFVAESRGAWNGLFVEVKRRRGRPTQKQRDLMKRLSEAGYNVHTANEGVDEAFEYVERYLAGEEGI